MNSTFNSFSTGQDDYTLSYSLLPSNLIINNDPLIESTTTTTPNLIPPPLFPTQFSVVLIKFPSLNSTSTTTTTSSNTTTTTTTTTSTVLGLASLGLQRNNLTQQDSSSKFARPFRGSSSNFVKSWEGILPKGTIDSKLLHELHAGKQVCFVVYTAGKTIIWNDLSHRSPREPLCRVVFSEFITCVHVNQSTASVDRQDILLGFAGSGDIFYFDPHCARYTRFNKAGIICCSSVTAIKWMSSSTTVMNQTHSNLFLTSHANGMIVIWDKSVLADAPLSFTPPSSTPNFYEISVARPPLVDKSGKATRSNPISMWKVSDRAIRAFDLSSDESHLACCGDDGILRIIDVASERLMDAYASYFGGLNSVAWSGRFVITGGEDDLASIFSPFERRLLARLEGHTSFVTAVAFDASRSDESVTQFGSVGADCKLILWELSGATLKRPRTHGPYNHRQNPSSFSLTRRRPNDSVSHLPSSTSVEPGNEDEPPMFHVAPKRSDIALMQPLMIKTLSEDPFSQVAFLSDGSCVTLTRSGQIRLYARKLDD